MLGNVRLLRIGGEHRSRPSVVHYAAQPLLTGPIEGNSLTFDSAWVITSNRLSCEVAALDYCCMSMGKSGSSVMEITVLLLVLVLEL